MTKSIQAIFIFLFITSISFLACKKDVDKFVPNDDGSWPSQVDGDIDDLFTEIAPAPQIFNILGEQYSQLISDHGTRVSIFNNSLTTLSGEPVTGSVEMQLFEGFDQSDMVKLNRQTFTDKKELIRSAGFFGLKFFQDGEELFMSGNAQIEFRTDEYDEEMQLFREFIDPENPGAFAWSLWEGELTSLNWQDTTTSVTDDLYIGYYLYSGEFEWINCDAFVNIPADEKTTVCADLPSNFSNANAAVFMVFKDINSAVSLWGDADLMMFCINNMPLGEEVTIFTIANTGPGENHLAHVNLEITENMVIELNPQPATLEEIVDFIDGL